MPSMTRYSPEPGDVVLVVFPFTDTLTEKKRPALIISPTKYSKRHHDVVIIALTSQAQTDNELQLQHWQEAGLQSPTWIKPLITTIELKLVERKLGKISAEDWPKVSLVVRRLIDSRIGSPSLKDVPKFY